MKPLLGGLAVLALLIATPGTAQVPEPTGISLTAGDGGQLAYLGTGLIPFEVSVGCLELVTGALAPVVVSIPDAPSWLTATPTSKMVDPTTCNPLTGRAVVAGNLPISVASDAPAVVTHTPGLVAILSGPAGPTASDPADGAFRVAYNSDYSLTPTVTFPLTVKEPVTTFTVIGQQASNAKSMIMVDGFSADSLAKISGIGPEFYDNVAGKPDTMTYTVKFTAPEGEWTKATATLKIYGHYNFDGNVGEPEDRQTLTWEFINGGVPSTKTDGKERESPAPVAAFTALGLVALAALLRRKA